MDSLDEQLALELFERGAPLGLVERGNLMMSAWSQTSWSESERLSVVQRDRGLIEMRVRFFGPEIEFEADCPDCGEIYEGNFDLRLVPQPGPAEVDVEVGSLKFRLRAPTGRSIAQALANDDPIRLLHECVDSPREDWINDADLVERVEKALTDHFPLLDVRLGVHCLDCEEVFPIRFDIVSWLWRDIESLARNAMDSVDLLARAYGWSEHEILQISPARREHYLRKVTA